MSVALLCPRSRTQNERAFGLRSQRVRHLHRHSLRDAFTDVAFGSISSFWSLADYFRPSPRNGHRQGG
jgi:hypothetical protein